MIASSLPSAPRRALTLAVVFAAACAPARQSVELGPLVTDRPDFTESAVTIPKGFSQLEVGTTVDQADGVRSVSAGETLLRSGVNEHVELRLTLANYAAQRDGTATVQGFEDAGIGVKVALFEGPDRASIVPTLAFIAGTSLPTGALSFRSRSALPEFKLLGAWTVSERIAFASNLNWARAEDVIGTHDEWSGSASFGFSLAEKVGAYAEYFAFGERSGAWQRREYVNGGVTYLLSDALQLDARYGVRTDAPSRANFVGIGLSRRF